MIMPATGRTRSTQAAAVANSRNARELVLIAFREPVAQAANGLDHIRRDLFAQAADEHLNGVGVAVEMITGMLRPARRHCSSTLMPSIFGRPVSRITTS